MGWAARVNPQSPANQKARMDEARWLVASLGRERVTEQLHRMAPADQVIIQAMLDELFPLVQQ